MIRRQIIRVDVFPAWLSLLHFCTRIVFCYAMPLLIPMASDIPLRDPYSVWLVFSHIFLS